MKSKLLSAFLPFMSLLFILLLLEGGLRLHGFYLDLRLGKTNAEAFLHDYDPVRGWRNKSGAAGSFVDRENHVRARVSINAHGLRGPDYDYPKPEATRRILLLGDSVAAGFEVDDSQTSARKLEDKLKTAGQWQVLNGGVRGYSTDQAYLYLTYEGFRYAPDIVIYFFVSNDVEGNLKIHSQGKSYGKSYFTLDPQDNLLLQGIPVPKSYDPAEPTRVAHPSAAGYFDRLEGLGRKSDAAESKLRPRTIFLWVKRWLYKNSLLYQWVSARIKKLPGMTARLHTAGFVEHPGYVAPSAEMMEAGWAVTSKVIEAMRDFCDSIHAHFLVLEVVGRTSQPQKQLAEITDRLGIPVISTDAVFNSKNNALSARIPDGLHWSAHGHSLASELVFDYLSRNGLLAPATPGSDARDAG